ncbi:histone acetyltransferase type B catalytic subunit-like isoform X2 [Convolutriloba macropyga]|uniref:histone acetyltransferase type B catalytic subunit-like isoform X2 n=1 Tax=Convolutriloba macropyga TaxID=536237 RepID=UPI003F51B20F
MVQCTMANLSALEPFKSCALECCTFHYVKKIDDIDSSECTFKPQFAHQLFGEDEIVFGYRDLSVDLYYTAGSLKCWIKVNYSEKIAENAAEAKADCDPIDSLKENFVDGFVQSEADFVKEIKKDEKFEPPGKMITQYTRFDEHKEKQFCLYKADMDTPGFLQHHKNMQTFLTWFIDGASFIDDEDPQWLFYSVFEKCSIDGEKRYCFVGYCTVYLFFCYPDKKRARVSQFLILPPYLRKGHGSQLLRMIYNDLQTVSEVQDITVEDPSEDFVSMRDAVDCHYLVDNFAGLFESPHRLNKLTKELLIKSRETTKINNRPKTKLSSFECKMDTGLANEEGGEDEGMGASSLMEGEYLETKAEENYDRILTHYMQVSSKLSTLL